MEAVGQHPRVPERPPAQAAPRERPARSRGRVGTAGRARHRRPEAAAAAAAAGRRGGGGHVGRKGDGLTEFRRGGNEYLRETRKQKFR